MAKTHWNTFVNLKHIGVEKDISTYMLIIKLKRKITFSKIQSCANNISYKKIIGRWIRTPFHPSCWSFFDDVNVFLLTKKANKVRILLCVY
jgi:hypothetical protein